MSIADIRTHRLRVPFVDPPKVGFLALEHIDLLVVEVETSDGVIGTGHLQPLAGGLRTLETCVHEMLAPLLLGEALDDVPALWQKLWRATFIQGRMGITVMAQSALDVALWDALGRARGEPLWRLWGGRPDPLPVYGSGCFRGLGHDGMIEKARAFVAQGFDAIKMQVAHCFTHDEDVANVRDMRAALGDDIAIMVDVNQGWTADEAITVGRRLDEFALTWLEEPVVADDFAGYHRVAAALATPVVGGENHFTHHDLEPFLASGALPILQPDLMRGGYTELRVIAEQAHAAGITIAPHLFPELATHLLASIPNPSWLEYMGWFDHLWVEPLRPVNGRMAPPGRPGHGMDFRPELFDEFRLRD
ncbi:MAG: mandelate racemase/muconate lactonizing enzyme family protein [Gammaproteobacteria bacterium]|nr:mandelate racemase/muconate lactonizing enzyme family protein [Gammaproteobacteria bacterium]